MKHQGFWIFRLLWGLLYTFIVFYMGYHVVRGFDSSVKTVTVALKETQVAADARGVVVRDETVFHLSDAFLALTVAEGDRVTENETVALGFDTESALKSQKDLRSLRARRDLLERIATHRAAVGDIRQTDADIRAGIARALIAAEDANLNAAAGAEEELSDLLLRRAYAYDNDVNLSGQIAALNKQITALESTVSKGDYIRAPSTGLFSASSDGLETAWTLESLDKITVKSFNKLISKPQSPPAQNTARIVRGLYWYYVFTLDTKTAAKLESSAKKEKIAEQIRHIVRVRFENNIETEMEFVRRSGEQNGFQVVVLRSNDQLKRQTSVRCIDGEILFERFNGLRIPAAALRIDDAGQRYVYCDVLGRVTRKNINVYDELDDDNFYLAVYDPTNKHALFPGDEVITSGKDLTEGKILKTN